MKIVILGDIHGNLPALEVCFEKAEEDGYDWIVHTGDVVGYGPFPAECIEYIRLRNIPGVRGNFDDGVGSGGETSGAIATDSTDRMLAEESFRWTVRNLDLLPKRWLQDLPFGVRKDAGRRSLAVFHASPVDLTSSLDQNLPEPSWGGYGDAAGADIVGLGHQHYPFHRAVGGRHFVNAGSVGRPSDGNPQTGFAVVETDTEIQVTFHRFPYDIDRTVRAMKERGLPHELAQRLEQGV